MLPPVRPFAPSLDAHRSVSVYKSLIAVKFVLHNTSYRPTSVWFVNASQGNKIGYLTAYGSEWRKWEDFADLRRVEWEKRSDVTLCGMLALWDAWSLVKVSDETEKWGRNEKWKWNGAQKEVMKNNGASWDAVLCVCLLDMLNSKRFAYDSLRHWVVATSGISWLYRYLVCTVTLKATVN